MRVTLSILSALLWALPVEADGLRVVIHSARPFGYFVGDLIHARVEILSPADATLSASSLPQPGPRGVSLDLRDVSVRPKTQGGLSGWDIDIVYQNFYVALDVRNVEIPAFDLRVGDETVTVPAWSVGVAPLREIAPATQERPEDYLRPDAPIEFAQDTKPKRLVIAFALLFLLALAAVARDRAWPPFQQRRARIFNALAHRLAAQARAATDSSSLERAIQSVHRAIDHANGASLLAEDVPAFLSRRSEFALLELSFNRFFSASQSAFFCRNGDQNGDYSLDELLAFAKALAREERAQ